MDDQKQGEQDSLDSDDDYQSKRLKIDEESDDKSNLEEKSASNESQKVPPLKIICSKKDPTGTSNYVLIDKTSTDDAQSSTSTLSSSSSTDSKQADEETTQTANNSIETRFPKRNRQELINQNSSTYTTKKSSNEIKRKLRSHTRQQKESTNDDDQSQIQQISVVSQESLEQIEAETESISTAQTQVPNSTPKTLSTKKRKQKGPVLPEPPEMLPLNEKSNDSVESTSNLVYTKKNYGNNCIKQYMQLRSVIDKKREHILDTKHHMSLPKNFNDFYIYKKNYLIANNKEARLAIPFYTAPSDLSDELKEVYTSQEHERYNLRIRHRVEQDKLILLYEQEVLRCFNQINEKSSKLSFCSIINTNEIYTLTQANNLQFGGTIVDETLDLKQILCELECKFQKRKDDMIKRHLNESDSLYAVQRMDWQTKLKNSTKLFGSSHILFVSDLHVPIVCVNNKFELTCVKI